MLVLCVWRLLPVAFDSAEGDQRTAFSGEDIFGRFGPDEGLWTDIVMQEIVIVS